MVNYCVVGSCKAVWYPNSNLSFFSITKDKASLEKWQDVIPALREVKNYHKICSKHFAPECIRERGNKKYLTNDAVPTIFHKTNGSSSNTSETQPSLLRDALICPKPVALTVQSDNVQPRQKQRHDESVECRSPLTEEQGPPERQMHSAQVQTSLTGSSLLKREVTMRRKIQALKARLKRLKKRFQNSQLS